MAQAPASPDASIDLVEVPPPFWKTSDWDSSDSAVKVHFDEYCCHYTRCAICGLQITDDYARNGCWASEALMVGDLSREYEYVQTHRKYPTDCPDPDVFSARIAGQCSNVKGCGYDLGQDHKGPCFPYAADVSSFNGGPDGKNVVYLPMHRACFNIALRSPRWDVTSSSRLRGLFRVLRHRFQVKWEQCLRQNPEAYENDGLWWTPRDWAHIKISGFQNTRGTERGYFSKMCLDPGFWKKHHYLMYDPLEIPSFTDTLLKNLEIRTTPEDTKKVPSFRKHFRSLPNNVKLLIYEYIVQDQELPLKCTRLLSPRFWKALFNRDHPCMGWLWDLDFEMVRRADPDVRMDWELLFRQLSQGPKIADCFGDHADSDYETFRGVLAYIPPGLEGRRRVWRLVEEMRIGDRSVYWELMPGVPWREAFVRCKSGRDIAEVPVYWGGDGEPLDEDELRAL
ncbi:hypothetical protein LA080_008882 [Diaporthe eres]|uniref:F-box domain-containing protein n=1 Tax=Diaporthe vaccinii TaxID=105482 RepID=A0ABR4DU32_9PEZI|nr:hypothetical protein LA080_008882 [Diaporthe eres]